MLLVIQKTAHINYTKMIKERVGERGEGMGKKRREREMREEIR